MAILAKSRHRCCAYCDRWRQRRGRTHSRIDRPVARRARGAVKFFFSSRGRHTSSYGDWSSDVCSSDLLAAKFGAGIYHRLAEPHELAPQTGNPELDLEESLQVASGFDWSPCDVCSIEVQGYRSEERRVGKECRFGLTAEPQ